MPLRRAQGRHTLSPSKYTRLSCIPSWTTTSSRRENLWRQPAHFPVGSLGCFALNGSPAGCILIVSTVWPPFCGPGPGVLLHCRGRFLYACIVSHYLR